MRHIVVATHGRFAEGIMDAVSLIAGEQEDVHTLCAFLDQQSTLKNQVEQMLSEFPVGDEVLVAVDLMGGSVCNEFICQLERPGLYIIAGLNLAMLLEIVTSRDLPIQEVMDNAVGLSQKSIVYCNPLVMGGCGENDNF